MLSKNMLGKKMWILEFFGLILIISTVVFFLFFNIIRSEGYVIAWDLSMPLYKENFQAYYWPLWNEYQNSGTIFALLHLIYPINLLVYLLVSIGILSVPNALKLMLILPFYIGGITSYYFTRWLLTKKLKGFDKISVFSLGILGTLIFIGYPGSLNLLIQEPQTFQAMSLLPLLFYLLEKSYTINSKMHFIEAALLLTMSVTNPHGILIVIVAIFTLFLFHLSIKNFVKTLFILSLVALFSSFWIIPMFITGAHEKAGFIVSRLHLQSKNLLDVFAGLAWYFMPFVNYPSPYKVIWLLVVVLAVLPLLFIRHRTSFKPVVFFTVLMIISTLMLKGRGEPLGWIYDFVASISGRYLALFRVTYFWYGLYVPTISVLAPLGVSFALRAFSKSRKLLTIFPRSLVLALLLLIIIGSMPSLTGDLQGNYRPSQVPQAYTNVNEWLKSQPGHFNVLWLPPNTHKTTWNPIVTNLYFVAASSSVPSFQWFDRNILYYVYYKIRHNNTYGIGDLLSSMGIKYIIYHNDVDQILGDPEATTEVLQNLLNAKDLQLVLVDDFIYVFENIKYYTPLITATKNTIYTLGGIEVIEHLNTLGFKSSKFAIFSVDSSYYYKSPYPLLPDGFNSYLVTFNNAGIDDLILSSNPEYLVNPALYVNYKDNSKHWMPQNWFACYYNYILQHSGRYNPPTWIFDGLNTESILVNYYSPKGKFEMPFYVKRSDNYSIFLRAYRGPSAGELNIKIGSMSSYVNLKANVNKGFNWIRIGSINLSQGQHMMEILNIDGINAFSLIEILPTDSYNEFSRKYSMLLAKAGTVSVLNYRGLDFVMSPLSFMLSKDSSSPSGYLLAHYYSNVSMAKIDARHNNSYIKIPFTDNLKLTQYTVAFWLVVEGYVNYNYQPILALPGVIWAFMDNQNNLWISVPGRTAGYPIAPMKLYHIVVTNDGAELTYYVNGEPLGGVWSSEEGKATGDPLIIGLNETAISTPFYISNLQFYRGILSHSQLSELYILGPAGKPLNSSKLVLWVPLNGSAPYYREASMAEFRNISSATLSGSNKLYGGFYVWRTENYTFMIRASSPYLDGSLSITVDKKPLKKLTLRESVVSLYEIGQMKLALGWHELTIEVNRSVLIDQLYISSKPLRETSLLEDVPAHIIESSSTFKHFEINASAPTIIIYRGWYDDQFKASIANLVLNSYPALLSMNAFVIENKVKAPISGVIFYQPQTYAEFGLLLTILSISISAAMFALTLIKRKQ